MSAPTVVPGSRSPGRIGHRAGGLVAPATVPAAVLARYRMPPRLLDDLVRRRLRRVLGAAAARPFYRSRRDLPALDGPGGTADLTQRLTQIAPLTRQDVIEHLDGLYDPAAPAVVQRTSGTSGTPLEVRAGPAARREWAAIWMRSHLATGLRPWHHMVYLKNRAEPPGAADRLGLFPSTWCGVDTDPADVLALLRRVRPHTLGGYPSALHRLAAELDHTDLRSLGIGWLTSGSETLTPATRDLVTTAFGARIHDLYGAFEVGNLAFECRAGRFHSNADSVLIEVVDDDDRPVEPGETGHLVVTGLVDTVMPLIRYRIGDRGAIDPERRRCRCGSWFPALIRLDGRATARLVGPGGVLGEAQLADLIRPLHPVRGYQFHQRGPSRVSCRYVTGSDATPGEVERLLADVVQSRIGPVELTFSAVDRIERTASGKSRTIISDTV